MDNETRARIEKEAKAHADKYTTNQYYNEGMFDGYVDGAESEHSRITELLKKAHETIGDLLLRINKKNDLISEAHNSMLSLLKVCQSPTLTTHGLANIDKAIAVVNQLRQELESSKGKQQ